MRRLALLVPLLIITMLTAATPAAASAPPFGNDAFRRVWERQDRPVAEQISGRSWTWGPAPNTPAMREPLVEGFEGMRVVQYFDKSRMEINDPTANPFSPWYVTNGLLPIEMMTGRMQIGYNLFEWRLPARIAAIGDPDQFPTYADLLRFYQNPGAVNPNDLYRPATGFINPDGSITGFNDYVNDPATVLLPGPNNHGVARAFLDFMNQRGLVYENGRYVVAQVYDPLYVFGLPVTGAYWVKVKVGGVERPILFQVFERRVLTYNPANPSAFRVEMGNVGQHYYWWRYGR